MNAIVKRFVVFACLIFAKNLVAQDNLIVADTISYKSFTLKAPEEFDLGHPNHVTKAYFNTKQFSINNALYNTDVRGFDMDHLGRIWFYSFSSGLGMIDGEKVYRYSVGSGLGDRFKCMTIDNQNRIWIGSNGYGIYCIDGNDVKHYGRQAPDVHINTLTPSPQGGVWATSIFGGAFRVDGDSIYSLQLSSEEQSPISKVIENKQGGLWVTSKVDQAVYYIKDDELKCVLKIPEDKFSGVERLDQDGSLWFAKWGKELYKIDANSLLVDSITTSAKAIRDIVFLDNSTWLLDEAGVIRLTDGREKYIPFELIVGDGPNNVHSLMANNQQLWLCSNSHISYIQDWLMQKPIISASYKQEMLYKLSTGEFIMNHFTDSTAHLQYFKNWGEPRLVCTDHIMPILAESPDGKIWGVNKNRQVGVLDGCNFSVVYEIPDSAGSLVTMLFQENRIWIHTHTHVYLKEGDRPFVLDRIFDRNVCLLADQTSEKAFVFTGTDLFLRKNGKWTALTDKFENPVRVSYMIQAQTGEVFFATWGDYVYKYHEDSLVSMGRDYYTHIARHFTSDDEGRLWLSGQGTGLSMYNGNKFIGLGDLEGRIENDTWGVRTDHLGRIWITTTMGYYRLDPIDPNDLSINSLNDVLTKFTIRRFGINDGLRVNRGQLGRHNFNRLDYNDKGELWLPTDQGLILFRTNLEGKDESKPVLYLRWVEVNGEILGSGKQFLENSKIGPGGKFDIPESLTLSHDQNSIMFKFGGIDWDDFAGLRFKVFLEGYDNDWREATDHRYASFENLPSGHYTLHVKAVNSMGVESEEITYSFTINKAYWETLWFKALTGALILIMIYLVFRWRTATLRKRQRKLEKEVDNRTQEIQHQKIEIEIHQKEILDSIEYAKRIQHAILPSNEKVDKLLGNAFIFYQPKDIVAGDFYWLDKTVDGKTIYAAADCTGHGVPGAMVSVVCNNAINRAVKEFKLTKPGEILDKVREIVIDEFDQGSAEVRDGMDIALVKIDGDTISYAGAHNPVWIVREGEHQFIDENIKVMCENNTTLIEILPDKQPIGAYDNATPFKTHTFNLQKGDMVYTFSDGYADQFGGNSDEALEKYGIKKKGKKLKKSNFKKLLLSISTEPLAQQKDILHTSFIDWRGDLEQLDDVCVIGVRV